MRNLILRLLITALSFYVTSRLIAGFEIDSTWSAYLLASVLFVVLNFIAAPIIKLLLLPINLLTLGLFRWVTNVLVMYIFDTLYSGISISAYHFPGFQSSVLSLPASDLSLFWVLVLSSLTFSLTFSIINGLLRSE